MCCGHHFCESCLERWAKKQREKSCPFCRSTGEEFQHFLDKKTKREINALQVRCSNSGKGCWWVGELGVLKDHLDAKDGCGHVDVKCPNKCSTISTDGFVITTVMRKDLQHHLKVECEKRAFQCEHCGKKGTYINIVYLHYGRCLEFPLHCPNKCNIKNIKRKEVDQHRKECPLEKIGCPFIAEGCEARNLQRKDLAEHMTRNIVKHQYLMLKLSQERNKRDKERDRREEEWDKKIAVITSVLDSLLPTCTEEQKLPLQSIRSVIDDSSFLKVNGAALSLQMTNFSKYKQKGNILWYSRPFFLGDVTGLKLRLVVYPNGIKEGAGTHVSLVVECLERDVKESVDMECGSFVKVTTSSKTYLRTCNTKDFCECTDSHGGLLHEYKYIEVRIAEELCCDDTLEFVVEWRGDKHCSCTCHMSVDKGSSSSDDD